MIRVYIPSALCSCTKGVAEVEGRGTTLAEVLADLDARHPGIRSRIVDGRDRIREHMRFFVNGDDAREVGRRVGVGDEVHIIAALSGGAAGGIKCALHPDRAAGRICTVCRRPVCLECATKGQRDTFCPECLARRGGETRDLRPTGFSYFLGMVGGTVAAALAGFGWFACASKTHGMIGLFDVLAGILVGFGVVAFSGGRRGLGLSFIAIPFTLAAILIGEYLLFARAQRMGNPQLADASWLDMEVTRLFQTRLSQDWGLLFNVATAFAMAVAWFIPLPPEMKRIVGLSRSRRDSSPPLADS